MTERAEIIGEEFGHSISVAEALAELVFDRAPPARRRNP